MGYKKQYVPLNNIYDHPSKTLVPGYYAQMRYEWRGPQGMEWTKWVFVLPVMGPYMSEQECLVHIKEYQKTLKERKDKTKYEFRTIEI